MSIKIEFLPISGESILITTDQTTILIDGGRKKDFKVLKNKLLSLNKPIDVMILTHIDDDHIGGLIKLFENLDDFNIKEIWFNCTVKQRIFYKNEKEFYQTSYKNGFSLSELINNRNVLHKNFITVDLYPNFIFINKDIKLKILSPTNESLEKLFIEWDEKLYGHIETNTSGYNDYARSINELMESNLGIDTSIQNKSSIAFILFYEGYKFLFLGDAHADIIEDSLSRWSYESNEVCNFELIKMSHHGSSNNISNDLLAMWKCQNYIFCSKGWSHLPHKKTLAYLMKYNTGKLVSFFINKNVDNIGLDKYSRKLNFNISDKMEFFYD